jgi:hypothetical protein
MNRKGQFSIIAALLVAIILVASAMATYSAIHYNTAQEQPQILSAVDETNLALKEILGFTVGYYGSVLKVTGNMTYAHQLASNYLNSGLNNMGEIRPEWGASFTVTGLDLKAKWFSNQSFSQGNVSVTYNLNGLGISGISYNTSIRLDVAISAINSSSQAQLKITKDDGEPLVNLGRSNLMFYRYLYGNSTWDLTEATNITSYADGTYVMNLPSGVLGGSYGIQVQDNRGLMVVASSFSQFCTSLNWNSSAVSQGIDYVDVANLNVWGTHSNFTAQQYGPDGVSDTLTEEATGLAGINYSPLTCNLLGSTTISQSSGNITTDTNANDANYLQLRSYPSAFSTQTATIGYSTQGTSSQTIENRIEGSLFTTGATGGQIQTISAAVSSSANNRNVKVAIYQASDKILVASSSAQRVDSGFNGWLTFSFSDPKPLLNANTNYLLVVWGDSASGSLSVYYDGGSANQGYEDQRTFTSWPNPDSNLNSNAARKYSINCTYTLATQYTVQAELVGSSDLINWLQMTWAIDSAVSTGTASCSFQLYNFASSKYSTSGDGYQSASLNTGDQLLSQTVTTNPSNFRNSTSYWKLNVTATNTTASQFDLKLDLAQFTSQFINYAVNLQEQWTNVNSSLLRQDLCVKTGSFSGEPLVVQVLRGGSWYTLMTLLPNYFNNASLAPYIDSSTLNIRFVGNNDATDPTSDTFNVDSVYIQPEKDISFLVNYQRDSTFTLEVLQNGTMRWLGQNMQVSSQTLPVPPIPVKAIHVNETINGVNQEVPFQIEDWASDYQIPLGLTSNATVFSNRQMIVFLLNCKVTDFTVWWDGNDTAVQTSNAYTNKYFLNDNTGTNTLTNGNVSLLFGSFNVKSTVVGKGTYSTATFMRINTSNSSYGAGLSYVIHHGIVRDIVQQEAEWSNGPTGCPNLYANIVLTLPANSSYYTYQLRIMFINSTQSRQISDLSPLQLTTSLGSGAQLQTENGTVAAFPIVQNGTGTFLSASLGVCTAHHFSQFMVDPLKGAGLFFTDNDNRKLYAFDSIAGSLKGGLHSSLGVLEMWPVSSSFVQFTYAYDITWQGAVATFDSNTPVCGMYDGTTPYGLWILVEYPPVLTITAKS